MLNLPEEDQEECISDRDLGGNGGILSWTSEKNLTKVWAGVKEPTGDIESIQKEAVIICQKEAR